MLASPLAAPASQLSARPDQVRLAETSFWGARRATNRRATIPSQLRQLRETGRLAALDPAHAGERHPFWDSDIAKWLEAACEEIAGGGDDPAIRAGAREIMEAFARGQDADGYVGSWLRNRPEARYRDLIDGHELYTVGHLLEACCAYHQAGLGDVGLGVARRLLDHLWREFGPAGRAAYCGHPELELALMRLWRVDGDGRARRLAQLQVDRRGAAPHAFDAELRARGEDRAKHDGFRFGGDWSQYIADRPLRDETAAVGHAVRALYLYSGMADLAAAGDASLRPALDRLWRSSVHRRMYVTGGMGSTKRGERFTADYDLPDDTAYCETCAAIALARWASRMLALELKGEYGDVMERALHNNALAGISLDGERYFYSNPLAVGGVDRRGDEEHVQPRRRPWFGCACCPPNIARTLAQLGSFAYSCSDERIAVHLYLAGEATLALAGVPVRLRVESGLPWAGSARLVVEPERPVSGELALRLPGWCAAPRATVDGRPVGGANGGEVRDGYLRLRREWCGGEVVELELPLEARRTFAHPAVRSAAGKVALERGPLVYCVEQADAGAQLDDLRLPDDAALSARPSEACGGCVVIEAEGERTDPADWDGALYRAAAPRRAPARLTAVPYCLWGNREAGEMRVWIRR